MAKRTHDDKTGDHSPISPILGRECGISHFHSLHALADHSTQRLCDLRERNTCVVEWYSSMDSFGVRHVISFISLSSLLSLTLWSRQLVCHSQVLRGAIEENGGRHLCQVPRIKDANSRISCALVQDSIFDGRNVVAQDVLHEMVWSKECEGDA